MLNKAVIENTSIDILLNEIEIDNENCEFSYITEYEIIVDVLKRLFGNHGVVLGVDEALKELKENAEECRAFDAIRMETLRNTGDEDLAEDAAWELVYG